jgi:hypothetical protein
MKVHILKDEDFADLRRRIELNYLNRAERAGQPWNTSFMTDDPRGVSISDQFRSTSMELIRWMNEHDIKLSQP